MAGAQAMGMLAVRYTAIYDDPEHDAPEADIVVNHYQGVCRNGSVSTAEARPRRPRAGRRMQGRHEPAPPTGRSLLPEPVASRLPADVLRIEARALLDAAERFDEAAFDKAVALLAGCRGKAILMGAGTLGVIAQKVAATLTSTGTPAIFLHPEYGPRSTAASAPSAGMTWSSPLATAARPTNSGRFSRTYATGGWT